jgi:hypothetical protein
MPTFSMLKFKRQEGCFHVTRLCNPHINTGAWDNLFQSYRKKLRDEWLYFATPLTTRTLSNNMHLWVLPIQLLREYRWMNEPFPVFHPLCTDVFPSFWYNKHSAFASIRSQPRRNLSIIMQKCIERPVMNARYQCFKGPNYTITPIRQILGAFRDALGYWILLREHISWRARVLNSLALHVGVFSYLTWELYTI